MFTRRSSSSILDLQTMLWLTPEVLRRSSVVSLGSATESARLHRHFFAKLERGEPVTILGVGSSVTKGAGGCSVSISSENRSSCCGSAPCAGFPGSPSWPAAGVGFLRQFFDFVNSTWPHPRHALRRRRGRRRIGRRAATSARTATCCI